MQAGGSLWAMAKICGWAWLGRPSMARKGRAVGTWTPALLWPCGGPGLRTEISEDRNGVLGPGQGWGASGWAEPYGHDTMTTASVVNEMMLSTHMKKYLSI